MRDAAVGGEHAAERLLLEPATRVTCPKCEHEFSLEQGFARKSLEQLASASEDALAGVRQSVAASVEARLAREAAERDLQSKSELESLRKLLKERDEQHANSLRQMLAERDDQLKALLSQQQELAECQGFTAFARPGRRPSPAGPSAGLVAFPGCGTVLGFLRSPPGDSNKE